MYRLLLPRVSVHLFSMSPRVVHSSSFSFLFYFFSFFLFLLLLLDRNYVVALGSRLPWTVSPWNSIPLTSAFFVFLLLVASLYCYTDVPLWWEVFHVRSMLVRSLSLLVPTIALLSIRCTSASSLHPPLRQLRRGPGQVVPPGFCLRLTLDHCSRVFVGHSCLPSGFCPFERMELGFLFGFSTSYKFNTLFPVLRTGSSLPYLLHSLDIASLSCYLTMKICCVFFFIFRIIIFHVSSKLTRHIFIFI